MSLFHANAILPTKTGLRLSVNAPVFQLKKAKFTGNADDVASRVMPEKVHRQDSATCGSAGGYRQRR